MSSSRFGGPWSAQTDEPAQTAVNAELEALLTLRLTPQLGARRVAALCLHFGSAQAALQAPLTELRQVPGLDVRALTQLGTARIQAAQQARAEIIQARQAGVTLLGRGLPGYPAALEALHDPPPVLWVRGPLPPLPTVPQAIGIVGTRTASTQAQELARHLATDLARAGITVVSGLARGIDTVAHHAAVVAGGISIAVLGSAVDVIYPRENTALAGRLTLLSEYPLGTGPTTHHFPTRNRLIAALSAGTVVVEGELRSGSLITATHALECGRTVFAVPGLAGNPRAAGPHRLLREGAVLTETAQDILDELGWGQTPASVRPDLPPDQQRVWEALGQPATLDDLQAITGQPLANLQAALVMLHLQGLADEVGGRWIRR